MGVETSMQPLGRKRRNLVFASFAVFFVLLLLYSQLQHDTEKLKSLLPVLDEKLAEKASEAHASKSGSDKSQKLDVHADENADGENDKPKPSSAPFVISSDPGKEKVSHLHFLVPASDANVELCYNLASSVINRYVPMILGYHGEGLFDAAKSHLAKLHAIKRYLDQLPSAEDDDLVAIVDGYDIIMQLPADVMIERYFEMRNKADARLAKRFAVSVEEARSLGLRQTIFWGPDKICWPIDWNEPRCWAVPTSNLPLNAFGPKEGNGEMFYNDPRWLNSGTVIGPAADVRKYVDAAMVEIEQTYDPKFVNSESDQFYLANIWGRQEYYRSLKANAGQGVEGPEKKKLPREAEVTEYHISVDYESLLFQTKAGYEPFFGYLEFNQSGVNAIMDRDIFKGEDPSFEPYDIQMPPSVVTSMTRIFEGIADRMPSVHAGDWVRDLALGTNFVTKHIFVLWHCTGPKQWIAAEYEKFWFYPYARSLVKAAVKASQEEKLLTGAIIDGRKWATKFAYPDAKSIPEPLGGSWTDFNGTTFFSWTDLCGEHEDVLFSGEDKSS